MATVHRITTLRSLQRSPLPLWAAALLAGQAIAGLGTELAPGLAAALALGALLALPARRWRAVVAVALFLLGDQQVQALMQPAGDAEDVMALAPRRARLRARIRERSEREDGGARLRLEVECERRGDDWRPVHGSVQLTVARVRQAWEPGTRVEFEAVVKRPHNFGNPGEFDYEGYLARRGVYVTAFLLNDAGIAALERPPLGWIDAWRARVRALLAELASPAREILGALILGEMGALPRRVLDEFAAVGVSHVLSISGLHVAIVAGAAYVVCRWLLSRSRGLLLRAPVPLLAAGLSLLPVWLYAELAAAGVATWRSLVMLSLVIGAVLVGRRGDLAVSLAAAALAVSVLWPGAVLDISFQLSFISVFALVLSMERYWLWWGAYREAHLLDLRSPLFRYCGWALASIVVNLSALAATAPLTAFHFNQIPLLALIANPLVVPVLGTAAVALGLLGAFAALVAAATAPWIFVAAGIAARFGAWLTACIAALPGAGAHVVTPTPWEIALAYGVLASWALLAGRARRAVLCGCALLVLLDIGVQVRQRYFRPELRLTFLSVGQGDCTVIEFPGSEVMVVDGGGLYGIDVGERVIGPYLWRRKIARVDYLVLTHPEFDHYGGLEYVARNFAPREFWYSGVTSTAERYAGLRRALREGDTREVVVSAAATREIGGCRVDVVWPVATHGLGTNDTSVVIHIACGRSSLLLAGDLEAAGESSLLASGETLRSDILKAGHHGSRTSSTRAFLQAVRPRIAVVSAGRDNRFHFPDPTVLHALDGAGAEIYRTDLDGAVIVRADFDGEIRIQTGARRSPRSTVVDSP